MSTELLNCQELAKALGRSPFYVTAMIRAGTSRMEAPPKVSRSALASQNIPDSSGKKRERGDWQIQRELKHIERPIGQNTTGKSWSENIKFRSDGSMNKWRSKRVNASAAAESSRGTIKKTLLTLTIAISQPWSGELSAIAAIALSGSARTPQPSLNHSQLT